MHKALLQYGHALWTKHNRDSNFKRNIRYDDTEKTFCMDIKFPSKQEWVTVDYGRAMFDKRRNKASEDVDLLSSAPTQPVPALEMETDGLAEASGAAGPTGSITSMSWRVPRNK